MGNYFFKNKNKDDNVDSLNWNDVNTYDMSSHVDNLDISTKNKIDLNEILKQLELSDSTQRGGESITSSYVDSINHLLKERILNEEIKII